MYLVSWKQTGKKHYKPTWEPKENLKSSPEKLKQFQNKNKKIFRNIKKKNKKNKSKKLKNIITLNKSRKRNFSNINDIESNCINYNSDDKS